MKKTNVMLSLAAAIALTACGGGGGGGGGGNQSSASVTPSSSSASSVSSVVETSSSVVSSSSSASSVDFASCENFNTVQGYAAQGSGVTGGTDTGLGNNVITVNTGAQLSAALSATNATYKDKPLVIYIDGKITWENSNNAEIRIRRSNVSIIGLENSGEFDGVGIRISHGASNILIRNLLMHEVPQSRGAGDHINLDGQDGAVSNIWIDHNEFYNDLTVDKDFYDELVSGRSAVHNVTISYNILRNSQKTSLWGSSDTAAEEDVGRTISYHHNYWKDVVSRLPLFRFGEGHLWNNYYQNVTGSAINSRMGAKLRIDNNVFESVKNPILSIDSPSIGYWNATGNSFTTVTWGSTPVANCTTPPCYAGTSDSVTTDFTPPYDHNAMPTADVKTHVMTFAGRNKINSCLNLPAASSSSSSSESSSSSSAAGGADVNTNWANFDPNTYISILSNPDVSTTNNAVIQSSTAHSVNGLNFFHNATGSLRHRGGSNLEWNFNGTGFASGDPVATVGAAADAMRAYIGVPVDAGRAVTITVVHRNSTSAGNPLGSIVFVGSDGNVLAKFDANLGTATTTTFSLPAGHAQTEVQFLFSREGGGAGGMHVTSIDKTYN
ncbi:hypothetical protein [Cellvibrio sp. NN19]|uniref:pectate lyase family protein n=1 Tax=Cellvibrio chitinivorans TaxID=3102792 RepID=UPI002B410E5A|nr:hypothetical protein [Cellvibrio sp. NN19]